MAMGPKIAVLWLLGGILIFFGARIAGSADRNILGATDTLYYTALAVSLFLILLGGFFWVSISSGVKETFDTDEF